MNIIRINDHGRPLKLTYSGAMSYHEGNAYWGCALAYRMLQLAGKLLSREKTWERQNLRIRSGHPGPGVRDTIEYVTGCVSEGRYELTCKTTEPRCVGEMDYCWKVDDGTQCVDLNLAEDIVPEEFLKLLDRINHNEAHKKSEQEELEALKQSMTDKIWRLDLEHAFPGTKLIRID
ncbi:MAG: hypothetical protein KZQ78_11835 [Candidatus Thiodiazotropha sp. (ex Ustalcina ferruginea)]|nr:hypothetical protein [Candidatus Thiodiazotropha sp. (ex Ustalcina ferruginea)]